MRRNRKGIPGVDPAYLEKQKEALLRKNRYVLYFNDSEMAAIAEYCDRFKVHAKATLFREAKSALHERWGADICEMEAAAVVLTCDRSGVPCLLIKTVSDGLTQGGEDFGTALGHTSALCLEVADRIIREL